MKSMGKNPAMLLVAACMLIGANAARADEGGEEAAVCCSDGTACNEGEACCIRKRPTAPCSPQQAAYCTADIDDCVTAAD